MVNKKLLGIFIGLFLVSFVSAASGVVITSPTDSSYSNVITEIDLDWSGSVVNANNSVNYSCYVDLNDVVTSFTCLDDTISNNVSSNEGNNSWEVYINSTVTNATVESDDVDFFVDSIAPIITVFSPISGTYSSANNFFELVFRLTELNPKDYVPGKPFILKICDPGEVMSGLCTVNDIALGTNSTNDSYYKHTPAEDLVEGNYTYRITVNDTVDNQAVEQGVVFIDRTDPEVDINSPTNGSLYKGDVSIETNASDDRSGVDEIELLVNGGSVKTCNDYACDYVWDSTSVGDGWHEINATVEDNAGNTNVESIVVEVDNTAPNLTLLGSNPQDVEVFNGYVEAGATAVDARDGNRTDNIIIDNSSVNTSLLGSYVVIYTVDDIIGNVANVNRTVNVVDTTIPVITLVGANPQTITYGDNYTELGATANDNYDGDITGSIVIDSSAVNVNVLGSYNVTYNVADSSGNNATEVIRTVNVVDDEAPVITLLGDDPQVVEVGAAYVEAGATADDNYDGNLTDNVTIDDSAVNTGVIGDYVVEYYVNDSFGNGANVNRTIQVRDTTAPVITLLGSDPQIVERGTAYVEAGATADDANDGNLTDNIVIDNSSVDTDTVGNYSVTYYVNDSSGNNVTETRTVQVDDTITPDINVDSPVSNTTYGSGTIYLNVSTNEPNVVWEYNLNGAGRVVFVPNASISGLGNGNYNLTIYVRDGASNENSSVVSFSVSLPKQTSSGGGGSGSCSKVWNCTEWSEWTECDSETLLQERQCTGWERVKCKTGMTIHQVRELTQVKNCIIAEPIVEEPLEVVNPDEEEPVEEPPQKGIFGRITGAVTGFAGSGAGKVVIATAAALGIILGVLQFRRRFKPKVI